MCIRDSSTRHAGWAVTVQRLLYKTRRVSCHSSEVTQRLLYKTRRVSCHSSEVTLQDTQGELSQFRGYSTRHAEWDVTVQRLLYKTRKVSCHSWEVTLQDLQGEMSQFRGLQGTQGEMSQFRGCSTRLEVWNVTVQRLLHKAHGVRYQRSKLLYKAFRVINLSSKRTLLD